jgi:hypothetical protein
MNWLQANAVEVIGDGLKILGLIAAAWTVVWQIRKQHKNSLALQVPFVRVSVQSTASSAFCHSHARNNLPDPPPCPHPDKTEEPSNQPARVCPFLMFSSV